MQPRSAVLVARWDDKHLFEWPFSSFGIVIWRQSCGRISGVEPSGLQQTIGLPSLPFVTGF